MDEEADDLYENTDFANTGLSAVALYDYQVNKLILFTSGRNSQILLRQIHEIFVTLSLKTSRFLKLKSSFWSWYHWRLVLPKGKIIKCLFSMKMQ